MSGGIAITGVGAVSAVGGNVPALTAALLEGRCGIAPLTLFPYQGRSALAAQVPEGVTVPGTLPAVTARRPTGGPGPRVVPARDPEPGSVPGPITGGHGGFLDGSERRRPTRHLAPVDPTRCPPRERGLTIPL